MNKFWPWIASMMQVGTSDSMARLILFVVTIATCLCFSAACLYSIATHIWAHDRVYDLPINIANGFRDIFIAAVGGKVAQRIWGEQQ